MAASKPIMRWTISMPVRNVSLLLFIMVLSLLIHDVARAENSYGIQIGSYKDLDNAVERVNYLKRLGYEAFYRYETVGDKGKWYRVYIARYSTREQAEEEARLLRELKLIDAYDIRLLRNGPSKPAARAATPPKQEKPPSPPGKETEGLAYLLHVSSFKEREHAEEETQKLEKAGQKAFYVDEELAGGRWFRVYIGQFNTEKAARAAGEQLKEKGTVSYFKPLKIDRAALSGKQ
ncbi:MAG: SPOR domain-containing protein [Thermodesulfobacteriota bacterium]